MKYKKDRVQIKNPRSKTWVKIDTEHGKILGYKESSWKNIKKVKKHEN